VDIPTLRVLRTRFFSGRNGIRQFDRLICLAVIFSLTRETANLGKPRGAKLRILASFSHGWAQDQEGSQDRRAAEGQSGWVRALGPSSKRGTKGGSTCDVSDVLR
jgi:hypothetical protein